MSTIAENFIKDGSFGRRLLALIASFYAIALLYGRSLGAGAPNSGAETIAAALTSIGLDGAADWLIGTLMESLSTSPAIPLAGAVVLIGSAISMAATFRRTIYNVSPQATFAYLLTLCLLIDLDQISIGSALVGIAVAAIVVGLFSLLPSDDSLTHPAAVALLMLIGPIAAVLYGPAKVLNWLATDSRAQTVPVTLEHGAGPVRIEIVESSAPSGAKII